MGLHPVETTPLQPLRIGLFIPPSITPVELFSGITSSLRAIRNPTSNDEVFVFNSSCTILGLQTLYQLPSSLYRSSQLCDFLSHAQKQKSVRLTKFFDSAVGKKGGSFKVRRLYPIYASFKLDKSLRGCIHRTGRYNYTTEQVLTLKGITV